MDYRRLSLRYYPCYAINLIFGLGDIQLSLDFELDYSDKYPLFFFSAQNDAFLLEDPAF